MSPFTCFATSTCTARRTTTKRLLTFAVGIQVCCAMAFCLDCPKQPEQVNKDWEGEVSSDVAKIGRVSGAELKARTKVVTQDLLGKLPSADKIYIAQMMFSSYCSALRDDK